MADGRNRNDQQHSGEGQSRNPDRDPAAGRLEDEVRSIADEGAEDADEMDELEDVEDDDEDLD